MYPSLPDPETLYTVLQQRDSTFEGIFVVGVKTTAVFWRPTCRARMLMRGARWKFDKQLLNKTPSGIVME